MVRDSTPGMNPNRKHRLDPSRIVETAENLARRVSERLPESNLAERAVDLVGIARLTVERIQQARRPIYMIRVVSVLAIVGLLSLLSLVRLIRIRWEFSKITEFVDLADAGFNVLIVLAGGFWFLVTLEARVKRKRALAFIGELLEFVQLVDVTQLYHTPEFYESKHGPGRTHPRFDHTYLLFCTEMLAVIGNLAPLYTRCNLDDSVWRAASDVVMLANAIEDRLLAKAEAIRQTLQQPR
jgi:hypothetical protein